MNLFRTEFRSELLGKHLSVEDRKQVKETGLLGGNIDIIIKLQFFTIFPFLGEEKVRSVLGDLTKSDELLKKAVIPKRPLSDRRSHGTSAGTSGNSRSKSPERGHRNKNYGRGNKRGSRGKSGGGNAKRAKPDAESEDDAPPPPSSKDKRKSSGNARGKNNSKKGECPSSFSEAWPSFFSSYAMMLITTVGLCLDNLPTLDMLPLGGRLRHCVQNWKIVCQNSWVLGVVENGYKIPLKFPPYQRNPPTNPSVSGPAYDVLVQEAIGLKAKEAVSVVDHIPGEYISSYFAVPKPRSPGKFRPILNLKYFNKYVKKYKFTMESLANVRDWIRPGAWCTGLDLKDAFPHISMHKDSRKYLRFSWLGQLLQWDALPFGLTCSPRVITKVIKPIMAFLRATWAILISIYIDDMLIQASTRDKVILHTQLVMLTMMALGWSFNWEKSVLTPSQKVTHLGFILDTVAMTITCPQDKVTKLQGRCLIALRNQCLTVHDLERLLGTMESVRPSTPLASLHYRHLQRQLIVAKRHVRRPRKLIHLTQRSLTNLKWWVSPAGFAGNCSTFLREPSPTLEIWSDANMVMGGARCSRGRWLQRAWTPSEMELDPHINLLELRAAKEGLSLASPGDMVRLHLDSTTACSYIRRQGGTRSLSLSREACLLWTQALSNNITLLTPHWLSSKDNAEADFLTRNKLSQWEFRLAQGLFQQILETFQVSPTLDAFASMATAQLPRYMTWYPDTEAVARDALLHKWDPVTYLFPPVPLMLKVLQRVRDQKIRAVLVCPHWPTSMWWPLVLDMMVEPLLPLPYYQQALVTVDGGPVQPYMEPLVAIHLSGSNMS